jgi:hypothetical protein
VKVDVTSAEAAALAPGSSVDVSVVSENVLVDNKADRISVLRDSA